MSGRNINFNHNKTKQSDFYKEKLFKIDSIDVDKMLVSKKEPYDINKSIKSLIEYNDDVIN